MLIKIDDNIIKTRYGSFERTFAIEEIGVDGEKLDADDDITFKTRRLPVIGRLSFRRFNYDSKWKYTKFVGMDDIKFVSLGFQLLECALNEYREMRKAKK